MVFMDVSFAWWNSKSKNMKRLIKLASFVVLFALIMFFSIESFKDSRAYKMALTEVSSNPTVIAEFGLKPTYSFDYSSGYSISNSGGSGSAEFAIEVAGTEYVGIVYIAMYKSAGIWKIEEMNLIIPNREAIVLFSAVNT